MEVSSEDLGGLPPRHGRNDGRIGLFAGKSDVEMFPSSSLAFAPTGRQQGKLDVAERNGKHRGGGGGMTTLGIYS